MSRWKIVVAVVVLLLIIAGIEAIRFLIPYDLHTEVASARAQGIPTSFAEIGLPAVPASQDASADYDRAWAIRLRIDFTSREYNLIHKMGDRKGITAAEVAELDRIFARHADFLRAVNAGAAKPHFTHISLELPVRTAEERKAIDQRMSAVAGEAWLPADGPLYDSIQIPSRGREAANTVRDEGRLLLRHGNSLAAAKMTSLAYNVGRQMREHSGFLALMSADYCDGIADGGLKAVLVQSPPDAELARLVRDAAGRDLDVADVRRALAGDIAIDLASFPWPGSREPLKNRILAKSRMAANLHWRVRLVRAAEAPEPLRRAAMERVADDLKKRRSRSPAMSEASEAVGYGPKLDDRCREATARRRALYAGACVLEFRARTGHYPVTLGEAVLPVPLDPFNQEPLVYRRTPCGFEVEPVAARAWKGAMATPRISRQVMAFVYPEP